MYIFDFERKSIFNIFINYIDTVLNMAKKHILLQDITCVCVIL